MTIASSLLDGVDTAGADPAIVTKQVVDRLVGLPKPKLRAELEPIVYQSVSTHLRQLAREIEDQAINPRQVPPRDDAVPFDPLAARRAFLTTGFRSPARDTEWVTWDTATVADHTSYAEKLHGIAAGTLRTAKRHERAAEIITRHKAMCLREIKDFDPAELDQ